MFAFPATCVFTGCPPRRNLPPPEDETNSLAIWRGGFYASRMNAPQTPPDLSVIVPMYKEGDTVRDNITLLAEALKKLNLTWELIPVNDGSPDDTKTQLEQLQSQDERIRYVSYEMNRGRGYALRQGFKASSGTHVITTEADISYGIDIIGQLYNALLETQVDVLIASPYMKGGRLENVPFARAMLSRGANWLLRRAVAPPISTVSGMTRGYRGEAIRSIPLEEDGKEIHLEIVSKASVLGYRFSEIPATLAWRFSKERTKRASKLDRKTVKHIISHLLFGFTESPILLFGTVGVFLLLCGTVLGTGLLYDHVIAGEVIGDRVVTIMTCIFLLLAGATSFLMYFISHQNREIKFEMLKLRQSIYLLSQKKDSNS